MAEHTLKVSNPLVYSLATRDQETFALRQVLEARVHPTVLEYMEELQFTTLNLLFTAEELDGIFAADRGTHQILKKHRDIVEVVDLDSVDRLNVKTHRRSFPEIDSINGPQGGTVYFSNKHNPLNNANGDTLIITGHFNYACMELVIKITAGDWCLMDVSMDNGFIRRFEIDREGFGSEMCTTVDRILGMVAARKLIPASLPKMMKTC